MPAPGPAGLGGHGRCLSTATHGHPSPPTVSKAQALAQLVLGSPALPGLTLHPVIHGPEGKRPTFHFPAARLGRWSVSKGVRIPPACCIPSP